MNHINPNHSNQRAILRLIGPIIFLIGLGFLAVGLIDFFSAFGSFGKSPEYFWCFFVGMPITFVGLTISKFAYLGKVARYTAGELAPTAKDTINYLVRETKDELTSKPKFQPKTTSSKPNIEDRIRRLEKMKQSGLINEEDFEEQKDRILSEI